jgi:mRNA-degrading endonuclease RelE of RelBE toxin-antitoxin system
MGMEIIYSREASKGISKIPTKTKQRIKEGVEELSINPLLGKPSKGELSVYRRTRLGGYRIIYRFEKDSKTTLIDNV